MDFMPLLQAATQVASRSAAVANMRILPRDISVAIKDARSAAELTQKAAGLIASAGELLDGPNARAVSRSAGVLQLAVQDISRSSSQVLREAGVWLDLSHGALKKSMGGVLDMRSAGVNSASRARDVLFDEGIRRDETPVAKGFLLEIAAEKGRIFRFSLGQAAFDRLSRSSQYGIQSQERLTRTPAEQAVSKGGETIKINGVIYLAQQGTGHLDTLREIASALKPVTLTTGYGQSFGRWYITHIEEDQEFLFTDGAPRKQTFNMEFKRYGEDYQNV
jgi:uncharacterized protein